MSNSLKIYNTSGKSVGEFEIGQNCIELEKGTQAVHDVVVAYLASLRAGTACTKNRSQVRGGGGVAAVSFLALNLVAITNMSIKKLENWP